MECCAGYTLITRDPAACTLQNTPGRKKAALSSLPVSRREIEAQRNPLICPCSPDMFMAESRTKSSPQIVQSCFLHNCTCSFLSRWMQPPPFLQKAFHCSRYFELGLQSWEWFNTEALRRSFSLATLCSLLCKNNSLREVKFPLYMQSKISFPCS